MRVELSGLGRRRFHEICAYIANRNPAAAVRVRQRIVASLDLLSEHPLAGPRWRDTNTRALTVPGLRYRIHYEIVEPLWGHGFATEALTALIEYLLSQPDVESVVADTFEDHIASRRVMEKAGMTHYDTRTETVDGKEARLVFYQVRRRA